MMYFLFQAFLFLSDPTKGLPQIAIDTAIKAEQTYTEKALEAAAKMISYPTVNKAGLANSANPHFQAMSIYLKSLARSLDLEFNDYGAVVVISLGNSPDRIGIVTHGDVVPAEKSRWKKDPFSLDRQSEQGKLIGRGIEDDKGPIALALYSMKALAESGLKLTRRIELIISYTEESNWEPFREFLQKVPPPPINIAIDASYPVTVAEKAWSGVWIGFSNPKNQPSQGPHIAEFSGGAFLSQVPDRATALLSGLTPDIRKKLETQAKSLAKVRFEFKPNEKGLQVTAHGLAAHSSTPDKGVNALAHLAKLLDGINWRPSAEANAIAFINQKVGLGVYAEQFGDVAFSHSFMGPLTLNLGTVEKKDGLLILGLNFRSPAGKDTSQLDSDIRETLATWNKANPDTARITQISISQAHLPENPPHVTPLLQVFSHFTGIQDPKPLSIGGGTHARLLPNGVNFGPSMPGVAYSGHSEHEFMTMAQFRLNLRMYTAMLVLLGTEVGNP